MINAPLKEAVFRLLPRVKAPAQYSGGELNSVVKDHRQVRGKLCLCFPDAYSSARAITVCRCSTRS